MNSAPMLNRSSDKAAISDIEIMAMLVRQRFIDTLGGQQKTLQADSGGEQGRPKGPPQSHPFGAHAHLASPTMIDLATWNLSVPVGIPATTINTPQLVRGYQDGYFRSGETLFFWAPVTGSTTDNAKYPRSELRETTADGRAFNWNYTSADNVLRAALTVNQVPSNGKIVIGQIHAYQSNEPLLKVEYQYKEKLKTGNIVAKLRRSPDAEIEVITVAQGVPLNVRFDYTIALTSAGDLSVNAFEFDWKTRLDPQWSTKLLYFKAGVYTQDNTGYASEGGAATFYMLNIKHDKKG